MTGTVSATNLLIVDADTHLSEPWDLFTSRAPSSIKDRVPQVKSIDGEWSWVFDGEPIGPARAVCVIDKEMVKHTDAEYYLSTNVHEVASAASNIDDRLMLMDEQGIWAQLMYPNAVGFGGQQLGRIGDEELRFAVVQIYNDAMAEIQRQSGDRIFGMAVLPWWNLERTLAEIDRIHDLGLVGVNTAADPQEYRLPDLADLHWAPMFDALAGHGLPLNFHIGASATQVNYHGSAPWPSLDFDSKTAVGSAMLNLGNARILANFIFGGILERHPDLKFVSVESGVGWLPYFLSSLDYQLRETTATSGRRLSLTPSEYFRRQCAACFWFEDTLLVDAIKSIGEDNCLFETDFPHPTCLYPDPVQRAMKVLQDEDTAFQRKVFGGNAIRIYNLPADIRLEGRTS